MVISPEHPLIDTYQSKISNMAEVRAYQEESVKKIGFRTHGNGKRQNRSLPGRNYRIQSGCKKRNTIYISDYVLMTYGTVRLWRFCP
jgi:leucyl-tRNA synthetase